MECKPQHVSELLNICFVSVVQFQELIGLKKKKTQTNMHTKKAQKLRILEINI